MNNTIATPAYDAIVVLSHGMDKSGHLNDESRSRMETAMGACLAREAPYIVTSGWDAGGRYPVPVAQAMCDYAIAQYPSFTSAILCDPHARDTVGDAIFTKCNIVQSRDWKRLLLITSDYHMNRAYEIFTFVYGRNYDITTRSVPTLFGQKNEKEQQSLAAFHHTFAGISSADDKALLKCLRQKHPFYNGSIYPQI